MKVDFRMSHIKLSRDKNGKITGGSIEFKKPNGDKAIYTFDPYIDENGLVDSTVTIDLAVRKRDEMVAKYYGIERLHSFRKGELIGFDYPHPGFDFIRLSERKNKTGSTLYVKVKKNDGGYKSFNLSANERNSTAVLDEAIAYWWNEYKIPMKIMDLTTVDKAKDAINPFFRLYVRQRLTQLAKEAQVAA